MKMFARKITASAFIATFPAPAAAIAAADTDDMGWQ
jgi:hypothetical protein